ncbi:MAG TPA: sugar diacid recognition domain-containing protein [Synergistaceae bacterium]|nr:sugar diacid recognition domain-containing protein [Synergistaceae bacterium]HPJ26704.1 sugar diacid recognition domain-containing protein [Synergistaceae bacterium]HPQ38583.1 sugar diacid recognition domain-containing protein [Synergistaceae bacterium]
MHRYAQEIAESTAQVVGFDVVITDTDGVIVGASDTERLGTRNLPALEVMSERKGITHDKDEAKHYEGNRPGIMYPLENFAGEVVGAMAITGNPDQVRPFALIVKKQIEMLLREKTLLHAEFHQNRAIRDFLDDLNNYVPALGGEEAIVERGQRLGYLHGQPYRAIALTFRRAPSNTAPLEYYNATTFLPHLSRIRGVFDSASDLLAPAGENRFLLLHHLGKNEDLPQLFATLQSRFRDMGLCLFAGMGERAKNLQNLARSCREAWQALELGTLLQPAERFFSIEDLRPERLLSQVPREEALYYRNLFLEPLKERKDWEDLRETIVAWCHGGFNYVRASESIHVHRNTLDYRLDKIAQITGADIRHFRHAMALYGALRLDCLLSKKPEPRQNF